MRTSNGSEQRGLPNLISSAVSHSLRLIFPPTCFGCQAALGGRSTDESGSGSPNGGSSGTRPRQQNSQRHWCKSCLDEICGLSVDRCHTCSASTHPANPFGLRCPLCNNLKFQFDRAIAIGDYRGILQDLVIRMKREKSDPLAIQLGRLLADQIERFDIPLSPNEADTIDILAPVPTHWFRRLKRGFHASAVIANGISQRTGIKVKPRLLRCCKPTKKQGTLSNTARFENMRGAFKVSARAKIDGKSVMLVDDVMTSGATINAAARSLRQAGARRVWVAVVARGARVS